MDPQKTQIVTMITRKKNKVGEVMLSDIKLYYKAIVIKQPGTGIKTDTQINRTEQRAQK